MIYSLLIQRKAIALTILMGSQTVDESIAIQREALGLEKERNGCSKEILKTLKEK